MNCTIESAINTHSESLIIYGEAIIDHIRQLAILNKSVATICFVIMGLTIWIFVTYMWVLRLEKRMDKLEGKKK